MNLATLISNLEQAPNLDAVIQYGFGEPLAFRHEPEGPGRLFFTPARSARRRSVGSDTGSKHVRGAVPKQPPNWLHNDGPAAWKHRPAFFHQLPLPS